MHCKQDYVKGVSKTCRYLNNELRNRTVRVEKYWLKTNFILFYSLYQNPVPFFCSVLLSLDLEYVVYPRNLHSNALTRILCWDSFESF